MDRPPGVAPVDRAAVVPAAAIEPEIVTKDGTITASLYYPSGQQESSALMLQKIAPEQVRTGEPYAYEIRVTNLTANPLLNVTVSETLPGGLELDQAQPPPINTTGQQAAAQSQGEQGERQAQQQEQRWRFMELAAGATQAIQVTAIPRSGGTLASCLTASYEPALCTAVTVVNPQLTLLKEGPRQTYLCDTLAYRYVVGNAGTGAAQNVVIAETLPDGLVTVDGQREVMIEAGDIPAGESRDFAVELRPSVAGEYTSRAIARSASDRAASERLTTVVYEPELAVDISGPQWGYIGQPVTYTVNVTNRGDIAARNAVVQLETAGLAEDEAVRELGNIEPGQTRQATVTLAPATADVVRLQAAARSICAPVVTAAAETQIRTLAALLLETVDNVDPVVVGENTTYTVAVKNQGSGPANNVALTAQLPAELEFLGGEGTTDVRVEGGQLTFGPVQSLPPGEVAMWLVEARAVQPGDTRFRIEMNSDYLNNPVPEVEPTRVIAASGSAR